MQIVEPARSEHLRFLSGGGDTGQRIAAFDWSTTPLGAIETWSVPLRTAVGLVVRSPEAMALLVGTTGVLVYNDAYAVVCADRHPAVLGQSVIDAWPEAADFNRNAVATAMAGRTLQVREQPFRLARHGVVSTRWFTLSYSPVLDEAGVPIAGLAVVLDVTASHDHADALRQSERRLERAQAAGGVGTFTLDLASNRVFGTAQFHRIFGVPEADGTPSEVFEALVLPEDAMVRSDASRRATQQAPLDVEYRIRRGGDGALRWIARKAEFEQDDTGRTVRMVGVVHDITERKAAQQALQESSAQFLTFAQMLPSHVWTARPDGAIDWFNDRGFAYTGAVASLPAGGADWIAIVHPDDRTAARDRWLASLASGHDYETEFRIRRADGEYRWHLVRAVALRAADGRVDRWVGTNTDIHERKLAEARNTQALERIWGLSQELVLVSDFDGVIAAVNPAATRLLGWPAERMVGRPLAEFIHPDDLASTAAEVERLSRGETTLAFENRYRTADGGWRLLNWTAVPEGRQIHAVARDVTREREAEEALRQAQKMEAVGQLTGGVAHDFNNLLTVIRTSLDLMRRPSLSDDKRQRFMASISTAVMRATKLTEQLLAFARRQALQPVAFDAARNVHSIGDMIGTLVGSRISVDVDVPASGCVVDADPNQFDTALVNMAVNARDAMDGAGRLQIRVRRVSGIPALRRQPAIDGDFVAVSLADSGQGIPAEHLERIFEPFFTTKAVGLGTGLGLSQVFGFAKQSGGEVQVESPPGGGAVFTLYLPRAVSDASPPQEVAGAAAELQDGRGASILVVEDNLDVAESVCAILDELGYDAVVAHGGEAALRELDAAPTRFSAVFSDVVMAGMDGIALGAEIRRRHGDLPVVLSSGYSDVLARDNTHGFDLLPKPYSLDALGEALQRAVAKRQAQVAGARAQRVSMLVAQASTPQARVEEARQAELDAMLILDTEEEAAYDDLTRMAASFCGAPVALISLLDHDRQWFKSRIGLQARETPREHAFCEHAIRQPGDVLVVNDASRDARFAANPLVTGDPNIRFYAGAPLVTSSGHALGTLCVIAPEPREIDPKQLELLRFLADQVVQRLEARRRALTSGA